MKESSDYLTETSKVIGALLGLLLPIIQFAFQWLPDKITVLFLSREIFSFISLITLILSFLVILAFLGNSYFRIPISPKKVRQDYRQYIDELSSSQIDRRNIRPRPQEPAYIEPRHVPLFLIPTIFILCLVFLYLGIEYQARAIPSTWTLLLQAFCYILIFVFSVFVLVSYSYSSYELRKHNQMMASRARKAINLAIENNAIPSIPPVYFVASIPAHKFSMEFSVLIRVGDQYYEVFTNEKAEILHRVYDVTREMTSSTNALLQGATEAAS